LTLLLRSLCLEASTFKIVRPSRPWPWSLCW